jgi:DNA-binding CsgD family transcriptional regulator
MSKAPPLEPRKKLLTFVSTARNVDPGKTEPGAAGPWELTVGTRRYRLVPIDSDAAPEEPVSAVEILTPRELQIVALVAEGKVNKQIADVLRISEWTVSTHLRRIFVKLGVDTRAAMVSRCYGAITMSRG